MNKRNLKGIMIPIGLFVLTVVLLIGFLIVMDIFQSKPIYHVESFDGAFNLSAGLLVRDDGKAVRIYYETSGRTEEYPIENISLSEGREIRGAFIGDTVFGTDKGYAGYNAANSSEACLYIDNDGQKFIYSFKNKTFTPLFSGVKGVFDETGKFLLPLSTNGNYFVEYQNNVFHIFKRNRQTDGIGVIQDMLNVDLSAHNPLSTVFLGWLNDRYFAFTVETKGKGGNERSYFICDALNGEYRVTARNVTEKIVSVSYVLKEGEEGLSLLNLMDGKETNLEDKSLPNVSRVTAVSPEQNYMCFESGGEVYLHNLQNGKTEDIKNGCDLQIKSVVFLHRCVISVVGTDKTGKEVTAIYRLTF